MPMEPTDLDRRIWEEELADFLPQRIFDVHLHCFNEAFCLSKPGDDPPEHKMTDACPLPLIGWTELTRIYEMVFPGRTVDCLMFGWVFRRVDFDGHNAFTAAQVAGQSPSAGLMLVHPDFSVEKVAADLDKYGFVGLKPYRWYANDVVNCRITDMLPEALIELANDGELIVMMHIGGQLGIAEEQNVLDLLDLAERYPKIRWDLAHMARSSIAWPLERSIERIKDVPNFWYDFSSVTYSDVLTLGFRHLPLDRIMFGSDFPCDLVRGTMVSFGLGWEQLTEDDIARLNPSHCDPRPTYTAYETIRAARRAIRFEGFGPQEINDIFYNNAFKFVHGTNKHS